MPHLSAYDGFEALAGVGHGHPPLTGTVVLEDPLDEDDASDVRVHATRRGLARLALIASETTARFQREGLAIDPMAWMIAPRRVFDGRSAVEACVERVSCVRALLLHGLGLGLDADPDHMDELAADDDAVDPDPLGGPDGSDRNVTAWERGGDGGSGPGEGFRLFTATAVSEGAEGRIHVFHALVGRTVEEALVDLDRTHGRRVAGEADVIVGFRPDLPLAEALVSPALADMLTQVDRDPASPLARGLRVSIAQRFEL